VLEAIEAQDHSERLLSLIKPRKQRGRDISLGTQEITGKQSFHTVMCCYKLGVSEKGAIVRKAGKAVKFVSRVV
jgi:hypothetical protein